MTELLPQSGTIVGYSPASEVLAIAPLFGRFGWRENCGIHALIHTGNSADRLYPIKFFNLSSEGSISNPLPGRQPIDSNAFTKYTQVRITHPSIPEFRRLSAEGLVEQLPALEVFKGKCHGFELGLAHHIKEIIQGKTVERLVSDIALYSRRQ